MRISDWSSDVCSSDLSVTVVRITAPASAGSNPMRLTVSGTSTPPSAVEQKLIVNAEPITSDSGRSRYQIQTITPSSEPSDRPFIIATRTSFHSSVRALELPIWPSARPRIISVSTWVRSEEHTSELQSLMRLSYAVLCLTQKNN